MEATAKVYLIELNEFPKRAARLDLTKMGFLTSTEAQERTDLSKKVFDIPITNLAALRNISLNSGSKNLSLSTKVLIGTLANLEPSREVGKVFNVAHSTAQAYAQGRNSLASIEPNEELKSRVDAATTTSRGLISALANTRVVAAITRITDEKLDTVTDVNKLADVASKLSKVTANLFADKDNGTKIQFNIFRPRTKAEDEFEVIDVEG